MKISMRGDYQYDAVEKLVKSFKELNAFGHKGATIIFKSPTGSGKTVMMSAVLDELSKSADLTDEFVYIWASVNSLHIQSFEKLSTQYLPDSALNMMLLENMGSDDLPVNTVLFCNWESMFRIKKVIDDSGNEVEVYDNKYVRIGETGRNLQEVLAKTRDAGRKIVLIIDEAHISAAQSYVKVCEYYKCPIIGFTATAKRLDNKPLSLFDVIVNGIDADSLIKRGLIASYDLYAPKLNQYLI